MGETDLVVSEMLVGDHERKDDEDGHCVLVVEPIGKIVVTGTTAKEPEKGYASRHGQNIHDLGRLTLQLAFSLTASTELCPRYDGR